PLSARIVGLVSMFTTVLQWLLAAPRLYRKILRSSSADLHGPSNRSDITATESAPASITERQFARVIPPIATNGLRVKARAARTPSSPITGSGFNLADVAKTGPMAR